MCTIIIHVHVHSCTNSAADCLMDGRCFLWQDIFYIGCTCTTFQWCTCTCSNNNYTRNSVKRRLKMVIFITRMFDPKGRVFNKYEDNILLDERKYNVHVVYNYMYVCTCIYTCKPLWLLVCLLIVSTCMSFASMLGKWILMYYQYRWQNCTWHKRFIDLNCVNKV